MERAEPPGRNESDGGQRSSKPSRINVRFDFPEHDAGIVSRGHKGMLDRPLRDMFEAATVREVEQGEGQRALRKTIAVFQGITARRAEGLMRYEGSVSVTAEEFEAVHANIAGGLDALQSTFKGRLQNVELSVSQPPETTVVGDADAAVELAHHEAPARHGEHRETDRDVLGSASTDA